MVLAAIGILSKRGEMEMLTLDQPPLGTLLFHPGFRAPLFLENQGNPFLGSGISNLGHFEKIRAKFVEDFFESKK